MQGFKPRTGRTPVQKLAGGGFVQSLKEAVFGKPETISEKYARQDAELRARMAAKQSAPSAPAAPAAAPPANAISGYAGMTAMQRREKEAGLKNGGLIRGPGTGTSDSIHTEKEPGTFIMPADSTKAIGPEALDKVGKVPVRLSNGEFELPPEKVQAVGAAVLMALKDATHEGAEGAQGKAATSRGFKPAQPFAAGGEVQDPKKGSLYPYNQPYKDIYANSGLETPALKEAGRKLVAALPEPPKPSTVEARDTMAVIRGTAEDVSGAMSRGSVGEAIGTGVRGATAVVPALLADTARKFEPLVDGARGFGRGLFGLSAEAAEVPATAPVPTKAPAAASVPAAAAAPATVAPKPSPAPQSAAAGPQGNVTVTRQANGNLAFSGKDVEGPVTYGGAAGFKPSGAGVTVVGAGNGMDAAGAGAQGGTGVQAPLHSGNSWEARNNLRNLEVSASSITNKGGGRRGPSAAEQALLDAQKADAALRGGFDAGTVARTQADASRYGADQRLAGDRMQAASAADRTQIERAKAGAELTAAGFTTRAAARQEQLQQQYLNAKTPEERAEAEKRLVALSGKGGQSVWKPMALQGSTDAMGNKTEGVLAAVNEQTGEMRRFDGAPQPKAAPPSNHVEALKRDPKLAKFFDQQYGPGAAAQVLGTK